jgi:hypothetical protein
VKDIIFKNDIQPGCEKIKELFGSKRVVKGKNKNPKNKKEKESSANTLEGKTGKESISSFRGDFEQEP